MKLPNMVANYLDKTTQALDSLRCEVQLSSTTTESGDQVTLLVTSNIVHAVSPLCLLYS